MSDDETSRAEAAPLMQPAGDEHTTAPNPPDGQRSVASAKWEMPKPVFQKTSGYLPQGFVKDALDSAVGGGMPAAAEPRSVTTIPMAAPGAAGSAPAAAPAAAVEPQPDLSEQLIPDEPEIQAAPAPAASGKGIGTTMIVLGLIVVMVFVAVFLTAIYFLFLAGPGEINNF